MDKDYKAQGIPIGVNDRDGHPIHIGDTLDFDADEWGEPMQFVVRLENGQIVHPGATGDLTEWCRVVECVFPARAESEVDGVRREITAANYPDQEDLPIRR